jgi:transcriptional regulator with XRE-family HTH domain
LLSQRVQLKSLIPKPYDFEPTTIGEHIRKRRLILGLTQRKLATQLDVNPWTLRNWESGATSPAVRFLPRLTRFLGYDPKPPALKTVADRLKAARRERGWSQKEAARYLGIDPCTWSSWERGGTVVVINHRRRVEMFLDLPAHSLDAPMRDQWNARHKR